jgi:hypothetical protein
MRNDTVRRPKPDDEPLTPELMPGFDEESEEPIDDDVDEEAEVAKP